MTAYQPRTRPYEYQDTAVRKALGAYTPDGLGGFALWCEPGTGKSKMAIDLAGHLHAAGGPTRVLVVAPKGVHRQWATEQLPEHSGTPWAGAWWHPGRKDPWVPVNGPARAGDLTWHCVNYEALLTPRGWNELGVVAGGGPYLLVLDESHYTKNYRAKRTRQCLALARRAGCRFRLLLSGTPIAKRLEDEWSQLRIADPRILDIPYVTTFRATYCVMGGYEGREFLGPRNLGAYRERTGPYIFRATKVDALPGLPPKRYSRRTFNMVPGQRRVYTTMRRQLLVQLKTGQLATAANAAVAVLRLQQISNGFLRDEAGVDRPLMRPEANPRLLALRGVLKELPGEPVVIWCRFRYDVAAVVAALHTWGYGRLDSRGERIGVASRLVGGQAAGERAEDLELWLGGLRRFLVATPGAGGTGLNLQDGGCRHAVYYSNGENYVHRYQSEDRIHRIGTTGSCHYTDLVALGSRDAAILGNLRSKRTLADMVLDDYIRELEELDA